MNKLWKDAAFLTVILTGLVLLTGLLLNLLYDQIGFWSTVLALALVVALLAIVAVASNKLLVTLVVDRLSVVDDTLRVIKSTFGKDWLVSSVELMRREGTATSSDEIWLVSSDLQEETDPDTYLPIVRENLRKGVHYVYFVPDNDLVRARRGHIIASHDQRYRGQIEFCVIPDEYFDLLAAHDIIIFAPAGPAYMNAPVGPSGLEYFICLHREHVDRLIGRLTRVREIYTGVQGAASAPSRVVAPSLADPSNPRLAGKPHSRSKPRRR